MKQFLLPLIALVMLVIPFNVSAWNHEQEMALQELGAIRKEIQDMWWQTMRSQLVSSGDHWKHVSETLENDTREALLDDIEASKASTDTWKRYSEKLRNDISEANNNEAARLKRLGDVLEEIETKMRNASSLDCE